VPFGVFLSGGVDSSANVALMSELMSRPVETFTVGFQDAEYLNELKSARRIAREFQTNHHEVIISEKEMQKFLPDLVFHQDEPIADPVCVPLYYVSKLARDSGTIVVQVGEGADEIFSGYENYVRHLLIYERFWQHAEKLPEILRRAASGMALPALEATGRKRAAIELIRRLGAGEPLFWGGVVVYDESFKPRVLSRRMRESMNNRSSLEVVNSYLNYIETARPASDFLSRMTYLELKLRLPELLLMRVDKITMATSVEARVPFLDHHLVEYALGLPRSLKVEGRSGKHILKRALEEILPRDLLYSRKRGFGAPVREWFRDGLGTWFDSHLMNSTMRRRDFFDYDFITRLLDEHRRGAQEWGFHLWALLNLSLWYERWIDRG
jgi:asparagine synthase (glutamine-hydrolysing)